MKMLFALIASALFAVPIEAHPPQHHGRPPVVIVRPVQPIIVRPNPIIVYPNFYNPYYYNPYYNPNCWFFNPYLGIWVYSPFCR